MITVHWETLGDAQRPIHYQFERSSDTGNERTVLATGVIGPVSSKAAQNLVASAPHCVLPEGYDKGHLIAVSLGGPNVGRNIAPMYPQFNRAGGWRRAEEQIGVQYYALNTAYQIWVRVIPTYDPTAAEDDEYWGVPTDVSIEAIQVDRNDQNYDSATPFGAATSPAFGQFAGENYAPPEDDLPPGWTWKKLNRIFLAAWWAYYRKNGIYEYQKPAPGRLRYGVRGSVMKARDDQDAVERVPEPSHHALAAPLDFIPLELLCQLLGTARDPRSWRGKPFTDRQILLIKVHLCWYHTRWRYHARARKLQGEYYSEARNDPHIKLDPRGLLDRPEVDHVVEQSQGGANFFCNGRLVSRRCNVSVEGAGTAWDDKPTDFAPLNCTDGKKILKLCRRVKKAGKSISFPHNL